MRFLLLIVLNVWKTARHAIIRREVLSTPPPYRERASVLPPV